MTNTTVVRARIDERTKRQAAAALKTIGLTVSDAFRLLLVRVAAEKALPFEPLNPNADTVKAMKAGRQGERPTPKPQCGRLSTPRKIGSSREETRCAADGTRQQPVTRPFPAGLLTTPYPANGAIIVTATSGPI